MGVWAALPFRLPEAKAMRAEESRWSIPPCTSDPRWYAQVETGASPNTRKGLIMAAPMALTLDERETWLHESRQAIEALAATGTPFTADDLRAHGVHDPHHPNAWGTAFKSAHGLGIIRRAGYSQARRRSRHGSTLTVWVGTTEGDPS